MKIRKSAFSVKLPRGLEIVFKINSEQKDVPFITIIDNSLSCGTSYGHSGTKLFLPLRTFPVSAVTFKLRIKQNRHMIEVSENCKQCLDTRLKGGLDLIANG